MQLCHYLILDHFHHPKKKVVTVNFTCQLEWDTECADIQSNTVLGVPVRVFWMRLIFMSIDCVKQIAGPNVSETLPIT